jgi:membrane-bound lytic murein transglycosylase D
LRIDKEAFWQSLSINPEKVLSPFWRTNRVPVFIACFCFQRRRKHRFGKNFVERHSGTDTTGKILATDPIKDSSKLFASLLSPDEGRISNFSVNPQAKLFVDDYIRKHNRSLNNMKVWGKPYFNLYDHILSSYGVPVQLKYLSVIESSLSSNAISWAGAVGPMANHGRCGARARAKDRLLRRPARLYKKYERSRTDLKAALRNLWRLATGIAAYNCGTGNVNQAIAKGRSRNFGRFNIICLKKHATM